MDRITLHQDGEWRSISQGDFEERFLEICESHRAQGRALAFAFVLFDRSHPYVRGALAQRAYWDALDELAGRHLSVFSFDVRPHPATELRWMHVTKTVHLTEENQDLLAKLFGEVTLQDLPCVVFFQVDEERVIDALAVKLTATGLPATYEELRSVIGAGARAVSRVSDENAQNAAEIFNLIRAGLHDLVLGRSFVRVVETIRPVATVGGAIHFVRLILGL